jgi:hypothetical protein
MTGSFCVGAALKAPAKANPLLRVMFQKRLSSAAAFVT